MHLTHHLLGGFLCSTARGEAVAENGFAEMLDFEVH